MRASPALIVIMCIILAAFAPINSFLRPIPVRVRQPVRCSTVFDQTIRSTTPSRYDSCKLLISGVVGTEPKEIYLKSGHYVVNFALAVVGHYKAIHQQEIHKPAETMWLSVEMWDKLAKKSYSTIKKGRPVRGVGYIVQNKWTDKDTGEERKMYKVRITKMLNSEEFDTMQEILEDSDGTRDIGAFTAPTDSGFSSESPDADDQTIVNNARHRESAVAEAGVGSSGYTYRKRSAARTITTSGRASEQPIRRALPTQQQFTLPQQQHATPFSSIQRQGPPHSSPPRHSSPTEEVQHAEPLPPVGTNQGGQQVWESLKASYPGMVKSTPNTRLETKDDNMGPQWG